MRHQLIVMFLAWDIPLVKPDPVILKIITTTAFHWKAEQIFTEIKVLYIFVMFLKQQEVQAGPVSVDLVTNTKKANTKFYIFRKLWEIWLRDMLQQW